MPTQIYTAVLSELYRTGIIERKTASIYAFSQQLSEVSLFDLMRSLHHVVTFCESIHTYNFRGTFNYKEQYQPMVKIEKAIQVDIEKQLKNIKLSDLISAAE